MAAPIFRGTVDGSERKPVRFLGDNSATYTVGDFVIFGSAGEAPLATAGTRLLGNVIGFENKNGSAFQDGDYDSGTINTKTMAADNQTNAQIQVVVDINPLSSYTVTADATLGTTTGSDAKGVYFDLADEDNVDESSVTTDGTAGQVYSYGPFEGSTTDVLVTLAEQVLHR